MAPGWRWPLVYLGIACASLLNLFGRDWTAMVDQWWNSSTYNHILLVPGIVAWLVWQRLPELAKLAPQAWWPGLFAMAGALFVWVLGNISGFNTASQLGAVAAMQGAVLTILGPRAGRALLFPLCYALFLVPVGDELTGAMQMVTARIVIVLTQASGIPAHIEGVFIDTPAGLFEVAEACSGVKFLVAMLALGTLVAHVCFRSAWRRAAFMALTLALPILANGVRAWGTIYIAQSQGIAFAAGFDHIVYGWIFFAAVMAALLGLGWRFFDRGVEDRFIDGQAIAVDPRFARLDRWSGRGPPVLVALLALALLFFVWAGAARGIEADLPARVPAPDIPGWTRIAYAPQFPWEPRAAGADRRLLTSYRDSDGRVVDLFVALYAAQDEGREAGAFGEGALPPETRWRWLSPADAPAGAEGDRLQALGRFQRVAQTSFRHGDWTGGSKARLKLATMRDRLMFRARPTAVLILSAEETRTQEADDTLAAFRRAAGPFDEWMDRAPGLD
ncbi:exosortase A [Aurantiacibacter spongiae]|uniref:Exosortase A n=1 Tax=Aurantiacibacter spongiae TaxID=2488860 RepID=A0A3N5DNT0_9SPHN|nr:exosortase A [Aurantiacibacter spongiae]